ncbi:MAG: molecular chaperone HtpG [Bacteroidetes bacterium]|nr:molecular chaperone HtpG [Bacteroidota bacterium]
MQTGTISVQTENIFPIIKKFLYSDHEIFLRELVSNAVDATTKLQALARSGEVKGEIGDTHIEVICESDAQRIIIRDRGIGMTSDEVLKYLNQIAFSSAGEFLEKYKDNSIIGHFGLGFYSAFMVADKVEVVTKSWQEGAEAVRWTCAGDPSFTIETVDKAERGTDVILYVNEENKDFLDKFKLEGLLEKYCKYLPIPIQFGTKTETITTGEGELQQDESVEVPNIINETHPIWKKQPVDLKDEDYLSFYRELHPMSPEPMFWIHLNIDYPFNLTGVLYFPKLGNAMEVTRNKIHLYSNQVFVTDDVRDIVPEWLLLLHGVIDSPDIPLNVSRSYLQADGNVKKISEYITRKVADKLHDLFKNDRPAFEQKWRDLGVFVKYGVISDKKFEERANNFTLVENTKGEFFLLSEYKDKIKDNQTDKHGKTVVIYTNDTEAHHAPIAAATARGYDVLRLETVLDNHWVQHMEYRSELGLVFVRVDSDTVDNLVQKEEKRESILSEAEQNDVKSLFETASKGQAGASVSLSPLSPDDAPVLITRPEFMRRMKEMQALHGMGMMGDLPDSYNVVVNSNHPIIVNKLLKISDSNEKEGLAKYLLNLAQLQHGMLKGEALTGFVNTTLGKVLSPES